MNVVMRREEEKEEAGEEDKQLRATSVMSRGKYLLWEGPNLRSRKEHVIRKKERALEPMATA